MSVPAPHILIAGGGMVGLSLALLLHEQLPDSTSITLVEGRSLPAPGDPREDYHPSFDARSTALSYSTATVYRELGLWPSLLPGLAAIKQIHVSSRGRFGSSLLSSVEQGWDALGWVVENPCLGRTLLAAVQHCPRVSLRCPDRVIDARPLGPGVRVSLEQEEIDADLLVIADGAESTLREKLGFLTHRKAYGQSALIANVAFESDHGGCAYERFTATGPLALLPLPPSEQEPHRMALVWTLAPAKAAEMETAEPEIFSRRLIDAFGFRLGRVLRVGDRHSYPLALTEAVEQARRACVVLGNAAHALHPVAGQGFNLALRDAAALSGALAQAVDQRIATGDTAVLASYAQGRQRDQSQTIAASDGLPALFMASDPLLSLGRDLALSGMDLLPLLRREFVQQAAGMAALESRHV